MIDDFVARTDIFVARMDTFVASISGGTSDGSRINSDKTISKENLCNIIFFQ